MDAGLFTAASVGDFVWVDADADGVQDGGEPGLVGVTVNLLDAGGGTVATTATAGDGSYSFTGLVPGGYRVEFVAPSGYSFSPVDQGADDAVDSDADVTTGRSSLFTLASGEDDLDVDAGVFEDASMGDFVWVDADADGIQDGGEAGLVGVTVNLLDAGGGTVGSTSTAGDGSYSFTGLVPGGYRVEFVAPSGYTFSPVDQGGDDAVDSDADVTTGRSGLLALSSGENDPDVDAGLYQDASVGDIVWVDLDADGVQDSGEPGLASVTVNLLDSGGSTVATTATAGDGSYSFTGLVPGDYRVEFVAPSGYSFSPVDQGGDDAVDSDADVTTGRSGLFSLSSGENDLDVDAGLYQDASVGDFVWDDLDADGIQDSGEPGLGSVTVNLLNSGGGTVATTTTAGDGSYSFTAVTPGDYRVEFAAPSGYTFSPVDQGGDDTIDSDAGLGSGRTGLFSLSSGENDLDVDAGMYVSATVGDFVWNDLDADGVQDSGEPGLSGAVVNLLNSGGSTVSSVLTAGDGSYSFTGLVPGDYRVEFVAPSGYSFSPVDQGADDTVDSDADVTTGRSPLFTLTTGEVESTVDAGLFGLASVGDVVWDDLDADGVQDGGEPGLAGVTVNLLDAGGGTVASTATAGDGSYSFTGLVPGDYRVEFVALSGYSFSPVDQGADDTADSDADVTTGRSPLFTLVSAQSDVDVDAGLFTAASVGDFVWVDADADGVQDGGEPGLAGVTVNLLDAGGGTVASTATAGDGSYSFTGLVPGGYRVEFVAPSGYSFSPLDQGVDDTADSDADVTTGRSPLFALSSGEDDLDVDAGLYEDASVGDVVWIDLDADGIQDSGEPGLAGVTVNLLDSGGSTVATTTTAGDGSYSFTGLVPGGYRVEFVAPSGYSFSPVDQGGDDTADSDADVTTGRSPLFALSSGEDDLDVDAGLYEDASVGDVVWVDTDADGIQDGGESGLAGVTVNLLDSGGSTVATTATAGDGSYSFTGVTPGEYRVEFVAPSGYSFSPVDQGGDDTVDSDADVTTGRSELFTLVSGQSEVDMDAGLYEDASVGDVVWVDADADGIQDSGESGLVGVTVNLLDSGGSTVATTATAGDGSYSFTGVTPGEYRVEFVAPSGYSFSPVDQGGDDTVDSDADVTTGRSSLFTVASGGSDITIDAGLYENASIGDVVWVDADADGVQDGGEPGLAGVTANLLDSGGSTVATTTTAGDGSYSFSVIPGSYRVEFVAPAGFALSPVDQGGDDTLDSDADAITGRTPLVVVTSGEVVADLDGGVYEGAVVGDLVWDDLDADGIQDSGEPGVAGVTVNLLDAGGGSAALTVTGGDGSYSFTGVTPGQYRVEFVAPSGYSFSPVDQGGDDTADSDADGTTGRSPLFTLVSGDSDITIDAGVYRDASIGDAVWDDLDADGVQESGEPGLAGVTVNLLDSGGSTVATTTTIGDGSYSFTGVTPGRYRVEFVAPSGYSFSPVDQGGDDTADSDADGTTGRSPLFAVVSGGSEPTIDAGLYAAAAIGDVVWSDLDADGIQDSGEPGVAGVTVNLLDVGGSAVAATTTAGDGSYSFTGVTPGSYRVEFVAPAGRTLSPGNRGGNDTVDSDPDPLTGRTAVFSITSGSTDVSLDAGVFAGALLGDLVWDDADGDGVKDPGEPGVAGVTVNLLDVGGSTLATTTTSGAGAYSFAVVPGGYRLEFVAPTGYTFSPVDQGDDDTVDSDAASDGRTPLIVVSSGDAVTSVDAGLLASASIGDTVFFDIDGDGIQDPGEPGIAGITVELRNSDGAVLATTVTGPGGAYAFSSVAPGNVIVTAVATTGLSSTTSGAQSFALGSGDAIDTADFGFRGSGSIGQTLWFDTDGDGVQDPQESGLGGVAVELVWAGPDGVLGTDDDLTFVTITDDDGRYRFDGLPPGIYEVTIDGAALSGSRRVSASPDGGTDLRAVLSLGDGESITDADFAVTGVGVLALTGFEVRRYLRIALLLICVGSLFLASTRYVPEPAGQTARRR